jgi:DNA-binding CsgD family transcriptional regulator
MSKETAAARPENLTAEIKNALMSDATASASSSSVTAPAPPRMTGPASIDPLDARAAAGASPVLSYLVCTEPRTGSTLLCDALASTGRASISSPAALSADPAHPVRNGAAPGGRAWTKAGPNGMTDRSQPMLIANQAAGQVTRVVCGPAVSILNFFESLGYGAFLLDYEQQLVARNGIANRYLGDGLALHGKRVAATDRQSDMRLQRRIEAASQPVDVDGREAVGVRRNSGLPLLIHALRIDLDVTQGCNSGRLLLVVYDPASSTTTVPPAHLLADLFGLTAAEAGVATGIAAGKSLAEIAADRGVKTETARAHLKTVFGKTGTRRQAQLAALLTRFAVFTPDRERGAGRISVFSSPEPP